MKIKKVIKIIGIIALILLIIVIGYFVRNYMIISKLSKVYYKFFAYSNYSYSTHHIGTDSDDRYDNIAKYYYKDGKSICYSENSVSKLSSITLYDENLQEETYVYLQDSKATISNCQKKQYELKGVESLLSDSNIVKNVARYVIRTENIDGVECYAFRYYRDLNNDANTFYFNKETGMLYKYIIGDHSYYYYENWETNSVTENDVEINLEDFEITDNRTRRKM